jgi:hypothetical protein
MTDDSFRDVDALAYFNNEARGSDIKVQKVPAGEYDYICSRGERVTESLWSRLFPDDD